MRFKVLIIILDFVILVVSLVNGFFGLSATCYECPGILIYGQFFDTVIYGLLLLIFFICVSDMAKESIPRIMQLTASFSAAILYFLASALCVFLILHYHERLLVKLPLCLVLGLFHACVGLLFLFRDKLTRLT